MTNIDRRSFIMAAGAAAGTLPPVIAHALSIDADVRAGTIMDIAHVVILTQENRGFDHYFGGMAGVRGFGDRFPIPLPDHPRMKGRTVWAQANGTAANGPGDGRPALIAPFDLNTTQTFAHMRVEGTPHTWADAQAAWDEGRLDSWPAAKGEHAMGHFGPADIPFQYALADAFTLCDAYHCAFQGGTNPNRIFLWTGTNDPAGAQGGPVLSNSNDSLPEDGGQADPYRWTTYVERLQAAGVSWRIYQDMADNFTDNPLAGFKAFRDAHHKVEGADPRLAANGLSTLKLDRLREDVLAGQLPAVSYIVAPARDSEHPGPSSPAQGADFTARVIAALTADPKVWARTVLLLNYDENDGFFDHMPPPAPPSRTPQGQLSGGSTVDTAGEYHLTPDAGDPAADRPQLMGRPYGLGPRVPMLAISPWSRGGWVDSQVFDHTSVIRFLELRFGVREPNISPWRRAVCGDLTTAFDFKTPNAAPFAATLPKTAEVAARAAALPGRIRPPTPSALQAPTQVHGLRPSRALPYRLDASARLDGQAIHLSFRNTGACGAVFHVYDRLRLEAGPHRFTVEGGRALDGTWPLAAGPVAYDLWVLGPGGFHRHFAGGAHDRLTLQGEGKRTDLILTLGNPGQARTLILTPNAYQAAPRRIALRSDGRATIAWPTTAGWYDLTVGDRAAPGFSRRLAGRIETGRPATSDPAMGGSALMSWR